MQIMSRGREVLKMAATSLHGTGSQRSLAIIGLALVIKAGQWGICGLTAFHALFGNE